MHDRKCLIYSHLFPCSSIDCREIHVQICSVDACNKISIIHCFFCGKPQLQNGKMFPLYSLLYFSTVRSDLAKATRSWYPGPSYQWFDCLYLHCLVASRLQLLPLTLTFRFWIILFYSWNIYNLYPKWWLIWGYLKIVVAKRSMISLAVKYLLILKISAQKCLTVCLIKSLNNLQ